MQGGCGSPAEDDRLRADRPSLGEAPWRKRALAGNYRGSPGGSRIMSFQFTRVILKDWLVYGGRTELTIPASESERNLVIFNGLNGYGKTSLLRGLRFVFEERFEGTSLNR